MCSTEQPAAAEEAARERSSRPSSGLLPHRLNHPTSCVTCACISVATPAQYFIIALAILFALFMLVYLIIKLTNCISGEVAAEIVEIGDEIKVGKLTKAKTRASKMYASGKDFVTKRFAKKTPEMA